MGDTRKHRGPDHADRALFSEGRLPDLRRAVGDLSWLEERGYAEPSALKLVGDRYQLKRRQREAVRRASCSDSRRAARERTRVDPADVRGRDLCVDGFNVIITVEAALSGGALFRCRDGCLRDIASIHGSYRQVRETREAVSCVGATLASLGVGRARWYLDSPVSNSGRLGKLMRETAAVHGWSWSVELVKSPDGELVECSDPVSTSDAPVLDRVSEWFNLARTVVEAHVPGAWIVDLY
jgi:hypothetical protein